MKIKPLTFDGGNVEIVFLPLSEQSKFPFSVFAISAVSSSSSNSPLISISVPLVHL